MSSVAHRPLADRPRLDDRLDRHATSRTLVDRACGAKWIAAGVLAAATLLTYFPALRCEFINVDDGIYVFDNPQVLAGPTPAGLRWACTTFWAANWHPLTWISLMLDARLYGTCPWGFHLTNIGLHTANTLVLFALLCRLAGKPGRAFVVAGLFAWHPLHVESVAWIAERKDVLSTLFGLLAMLAYFRYAHRPALGRYVLVALCFALSLAAKPMLVTLPCVLLLLDTWPLGRWRRPGQAGSTQVPPRLLSAPLGWLIVEKVPLLVLGAASCLMTIWAQQEAIVPLTAIPFKVRAANAAVSYAAYLRQTVVPLGLVPYYPHPYGIPAGSEALAAIMLLLVVTGFVLVIGRRRGYLMTGWLWFLGTLVPVIGILQVGGQAHADRYTYFPLIGVFLAVVWSLSELTDRWRLGRTAAVLTGATLLSCAAASSAQLAGWHDSIHLWEQTLRRTTDNEFAECNLGHALIQRKRAVEAIPHLREALRLAPNYVQARFNLGVALLDTGQEREAIQILDQALHQSPGDARIHNDLGCALVRCGRTREAIAHFRTCLQLDSDYGQAHDNLGLALMDERDFRRASMHFRRALAIDPAHAPAAFHLGLAARLQERWDEAADAFGQAVGHTPDNSRYRRELAYALYRLGRPEAARAAFRESLRLDPQWPRVVLRGALLTATDPNATPEDGRRAHVDAEQVEVALGCGEPQVLDTAAVVSAATARRTEADEFARRALTIARCVGDARLAQEIDAWLLTCERNQPFGGIGPRGR